MQAWDPGTYASHSLAQEYWMSLKDFKTQGQMVLVRNNFCKHLLCSGVDHYAKRFMA